MILETKKIENIASQIESGIGKEVQKISFSQKIPNKKELQNAKNYLKNGHIYTFIPNRQDAITTAILLAQKGDVVIACGKGHEQTILLGETEYPWSESEAIRTGLNIRQNSLK
jgi:UDP-N-acetylmuramoyl-L-alanyl-D-glutamate--2,6-diaminopimelate ligase